MTTTSHILPIRPLNDGMPTTCTVHLTSDSRGLFWVTCHEVPEVKVMSEQEDDALRMAERAFGEALAAGRRPAGLGS